MEKIAWWFTQQVYSGKSLCFQFPPVYQNKKGIIVTLTISLMQDQVHKLRHSIGFSWISSNGQRTGSTGSDTWKWAIACVTPEWVTKAANKLKLQALAKAGKLSLFNWWSSPIYRMERFQMCFPRSERVKIRASIKSNPCSNGNSFSHSWKWYKAFAMQSNSRKVLCKSTKYHA
jgi:hypothetical protein